MDVVIGCPVSGNPLMKTVMVDTEMTQPVSYIA
jgi:hypothetical protein